MRQRTASRSRARSQTSISAAEEEDLRVGLQRLLEKLRQHQPFFTEDDVTVISFPPEGSSSGGVGGSASHCSAATSPRQSPSRGESSSTVGECSANIDSCQSTGKGRKASGASASPTCSPTSTSASVIDLDVPLSAPLFLTAVNIFDAKLLARSKRVSTDALKLVRQGYALVWRDPDYLATLMNGEPCLAVARGTNTSTTGFGWNTRARRGSPATSHKNPHLTCHALFSTFAPVSTQRPDIKLVLQLDECIRTLLVYANSSVNLCQSVSNNVRTLLLLTFVACAARRLEARNDVPDDDGRGAGAGIVVGNRNLRNEMERLEGLWHSCGIEGRVAGYLRECYLMEFLLDAALPPAVCSARYDGLQMTLYEKKQRIIADVVASRTGFAHMMRVAPLRGLCGLANMSAFGNPKLRARLLDKMAAEGVVDRLAAEMAVAIETILAPDSTNKTPTRSSTKRPRYEAVRVDSSQPPRARTSSFRSVKGRVSIGVASPVGNGVCVGSFSRLPTALERLIDSEPTPVESIGQCVDILMLLTCPNLQPQDSVEESPSRSSTSSTSAVVRSTTWASCDAALHEISLYLLAICFLSKGHPRYAELSSLQLNVADCVLQWAAYSGTFYAKVVHAVDVLLDLMESMGGTSTRLTGSARGTPSSQRASFSRSRSPQKDQKIDASETHGNGGERGVRVLEQLLPGDATGLLPLLANLLQYTIHAQANAKSIRRWFSFLADRLLPEVFEAPQLTSGRRSSAAWGRQQQQEKQRRSPAGSRAPSLSGTWGNGSTAVVDGASHGPVLARDLTRSEVILAAPYFCFARRAVEETSWRDGAQPLFDKVVILAHHVITAQGHRCNLVFGQACACYDVLAPLLLMRFSHGGGDATPGSQSLHSSRRSSQNSTCTTYRRSTILMHEREEERASMEMRLWSDEEANEEGGLTRSAQRGDIGSDEENEIFVGSTGRRRSLSTRQRQRGNSAKVNPSSAERLLSASENPKDNEGLSPFISSPSRSLAFYEVVSPAGTDASGDSPLCRRGSRGGRSRSGGRGCSSHEVRGLQSVLDEAGSVPPTAGVTTDESPEAMTQSWTGRLSLRSLFSMGGHTKA